MLERGREQASEPVLALGPEAVSVLLLLVREPELAAALELPERGLGPD